MLENGVARDVPAIFETLRVMHPRSRSGPQYGRDLGVELLGSLRHLTKLHPFRPRGKRCHLAVPRLHRQQLDRDDIRSVVLGMSIVNELRILDDEAVGSAAANDLRAAYKELRAAYEAKVVEAAENLKKVKEALQLLRDAKKKTGGLRPYGFELCEDNKTLRPYSAEQEVITIARKARAEGRSLRDVAQYLEENGYLARNDEPFKPEQVRRMLTDGFETWPRPPRLPTDATLRTKARTQAASSDETRTQPAAPGMERRPSRVRRTTRAGS